MGFPYQNVSECEVEGEEDCRKNNIDSDYCEGLRERFRDDCDGFTSKEECEQYWSKPPPVCDEYTPPGTTCYDEGDPDTCEPGFVDRGFGCEAEGSDIPSIFDGEDTSGSANEDENVDGDEDSDGQATGGEDDSENEFEGGDENGSGSGSGDEDEGGSSSGSEDESDGEEDSTFG